MGHEIVVTASSCQRDDHIRADGNIGEAFFQVKDIFQVKIS